MSQNRALYKHFFTFCTLIKGSITDKKSNSAKKSDQGKGDFWVKFLPYINGPFEKSKSSYMVE